MTFMENDITSVNDLTVSQISVLSKVKEIGEIKTSRVNYSHLITLLIMVIFVFLLVWLSVFKNRD